MCLKHRSNLIQFAITERFSTTCICTQGVIQDFEVEGGNEKSNQKMLLKKGQLLSQYPAMDTQS